MKKTLAFCIYGQLRLFKESSITYNTLLKEISKEYNILFIINGSLTTTIAKYLPDSILSSKEYKTFLMEKSVFTQDELNECMDNLTKEISPLNKIIILNKFEHMNNGIIHDKITSYKLDIIDIINNYSKEHNIYLDKVFITRSDFYFKKLNISLLNKDIYCEGDFWVLLSGHVIKNDIFKKKNFYYKEQEYLNKLSKKANSIAKYLDSILSKHYSNKDIISNYNRDIYISSDFDGNSFLWIKHFSFQIICFYELEITYNKNFNYKDFKFEDFLIVTLIIEVYKRSKLSFLSIINDNLSLDLKKINNQLELKFIPENLPYSRNLKNIPRIWPLFSTWKEEGNHIKFERIVDFNFKI